MPMLPTYDYETEAADQKRRAAMLDALQGAALQPMQQAQSLGPMASKTHWTNALAKLVEGYGANKGREKLKAEQASLSQRYGDELVSGMQQFEKTAAGGLQNLSGPMPDGSPLVAQVPGDRKKAIYDAMSANHPVLRDFAMKQLADEGKPGELGEVNGVLYDKKTRGMVKLAGEAPKQSTLNGDLYEQNPSTGQWKKLDNATKITNAPSFSPMIAGPKAGVEAWSKQAAETVTSMADSARQSVKLVSQLNQMDALTKGGTNAGPLADAATFIQGLANQAGMKVDKATLSNSQAFNSVATQAWAALMQQNGGARGLVKEESEKLAQSLPALVQTPAGRAQITAVLRQAAAQNMSDAKLASRQYAKALQSGNLEEFTFGLSDTQLPQSPPSGPAQGAVAPSGNRVLKWEEL